MEHQWQLIFLRQRLQINNISGYVKMGGSMVLSEPFTRSHGILAIDQRMPKKAPLLPGVSYTNTKNRWNNVFGSSEPNWGAEYTAFIDQQSQDLNA